MFIYDSDAYFKYKHVGWVPMVKDMIDEIEKELLEIASKGYDTIAEEDEEVIEDDIDDGDHVGHAFARGAKMAR